MGFFSGLGKMVKPLVNVPKWMNTQQITTDAGYISSLIKKLATPQKAKVKETFEESMARLQLTETDIKTRYSEFKRLAIIFFTIFVALLAYLFYLIFDSSGTVAGRAILLNIVVCLITLIQFIRFHYWMFQIKKRKLGCGIKAYFLGGILGLKV